MMSDPRFKVYDNYLFRLCRLLTGSPSIVWGYEVGYLRWFISVGDGNISNLPERGCVRFCVRRTNNRLLR